MVKNWWIEPAFYSLDPHGDNGAIIEYTAVIPGITHLGKYSVTSCSLPLREIPSTPFEEAEEKKTVLSQLC